MPAAIGFAIAAAVSVEVSAATATVIGSVVLSATTIGAQFVLQALTGDQKQKVASQQQSLRQSLPPRQRSYGVVKTAGPKIAWDSAAGRFFNAVYLGEGPINGVREIWLDDKPTTLAPALTGMAGIAPWFGLVAIDIRLGTDDQAASGLLTPLPYWSEQHQLKGCAYIAVQSAAPAQKNFAKFFPSSRAPEPRVVLEGALVRDVRVSGQTTDPATWAWNDRCGPCIYDLVTHPDWGFRVPYELMSEARWSAFNDVCDETIYDRDGIGQPRWRLGGQYKLTEDLADVLQAMLDTCDGRLTLEPDGTLGITGGQAPIPTATITDRDVISVGSVEVGSGNLSAFNRLKTSYIFGGADYQLVEGDAWVDAAAVALAGETIEADFSRPWAPSHNQLRRLAKIAMAKGNPDWRVTGLVTKLSAAEALFADAVTLSLDSWGGISGNFIATRAAANLQAGTCTFDLISFRAEAWDFDAATEEGVGPTPLGEVAAPAAPDAPTGLAVSIERRAVDGTSTATFLRLSCDPPSRADVSLIGIYRPVGTDAWTDMGQDGDSPTSLISSVLVDGQSYEVQGAIATYGRVLQSAWTTPDDSPITATSDPVAPDPPVGFVANGDSGQAFLALTAPGSPNVARVRIYRATGGSAAFGSALLVNTVVLSPNQAWDWTNSPLAAGTYRYWATAVNGSGIASSPAGPQTVTVT